MKWNKKDAPAELVKEIAKKYSCDLLTASILVRKGITNGTDILYFLEDDKRYLRSPFELPGMEDAVARIMAAKEEGEKVLVFGDRDADGVTSLAIVVSLLQDLGMDISWDLPQGDEPYGLTLDVVEDFAAQYGTLIVTVDCGISNHAEVDRANELNIDVIITDHHRQQENLPAAFAIVDPKLKTADGESYQYIFPDLAGCGVAYKFASAIRFAAKSNYYDQSICLLNTRPANDDAWIVEAIKIRNLVLIDSITETIVPGMASAQDTRLPDFFAGQAILTWDAPLQKKTLAKIFGSGVEFGLIELRDEIAAVIPQAAGNSLLRLKEISRAGRYAESFGEIEVFYNLFVSYVHAKEGHLSGDDFDLQLAAVGTIADLMPLHNENRILARCGLASIFQKARPGLSDLLFKLGLSGRRVSATEISWQLCPVINSAGRMGKANISAGLLLESNAQERDRLASEIIAMNNDRKELGEASWKIAEPIAEAYLEQMSGLIALAFGENIPRGATGITANRLVARHKVPAIVVSFNDTVATGSMRSARGYDLQGLLDQTNDLYIDWGGHGYAAGFSMKTENWDAFVKRLETAAKTIVFTDDKTDADTIYIDAELPLSYLGPEIFKIVDLFEPYGKDNRELIFLARGLKLRDITFVGRVEAKHLKLEIEAGKYKWPALYWNAAEKVKVDFDLNDIVDAVFHLERNWFKGNCTAQMSIHDLQRSGADLLVSAVTVESDDGI